MLRQTFRHIPGVGQALESRFWAGGVRSWDAVEPARLKLGGKRLAEMMRFVDLSGQRLAAGDAGFFADLLPSSLSWRMFPEFRSGAAYLDIETTGLWADADHATTIALYDGGRVRHYVHGRNLDEFERDIADFDLIVSYNGKCFDVPFLTQRLGCRLPQAHIDLRYVLRSLGYGGGLKSCEQALGFSRPGLEGVDGYFAVLLWDDYVKTGSEEALETLLAYNVEDVLTLERLLVFAYNEKLKSTPFAGSLALPAPATAQNPFRPHADAIARVRRRLAGASFSLRG